MQVLVPLVLAYALADRFAGGGWPKLDDKLPGRAAFWGAVMAAGVGYLALDLYGALMGLVFLIWRTPGWRVFGGSMTPTTAKEYAGTFARHLIAAPLAACVAYWTHYPVAQTAAAFVGFALVATGLAAWFGRKNASGHIGNFNTFVELARGASFGLAVAGVAVAYPA